MRKYFCDCCSKEVGEVFDLGFKAHYKELCLSCYKDKEKRMLLILKESKGVN